MVPIRPSHQGCATIQARCRSRPAPRRGIGEVALRAVPAAAILKDHRVAGATKKAATSGAAAGPPCRRRSRSASARPCRRASAPGSPAAGPGQAGRRRPGGRVGREPDAVAHAHHDIACDDDVVGDPLEARGAGIVRILKIAQRSSRPRCHWPVPRERAPNALTNPASVAIGLRRVGDIGEVPSPAQ